MKKLIIVMALIISILAINKDEDKVIIPNNSIRFRVIANSDTREDQTIKKKIVSNLSTNISKTSSLSSLNEARTFIKNSLPTFNQIVEKTLEEEGKNRTFNINYGKNYFPKKEYAGVLYEEGEYESLVITLGNGQGANFWCVLFPPLCMIDEENSIEYKSLIKEVLDKYI